MKRLFNSTSKYDKPIFKDDYNLLYLEYYDANDFASINSIWGLTQQEAEIFGKYMYYVMSTFCNDAILHQVVEKDIGLVTRRTITEWLFNYVDPLLVLLQNPSASNSTLMLNDTSLDVAYNRWGYTVWNTGYYNLTFRGQYSMDNGMTELPFWNAPIYTSGTDGTQFEPGLHHKSEVSVWFPQTERPEVFQVVGTTQHKGIDCLRFALKPEMIAVDPVFNNLYDGFNNMTVLGAPIFISKFYFLDASSEWNQKLSGIKYGSFPDNDTILDVEPITGATLSAHKRIQLNVYLSNDSNVISTYQNTSLYYPNVKRGVMYPLALMEETAEISEELADEFIHQVYFLFRLQYASIWGCMGASLLLAIVGFVLLYRSFATSPIKEEEAEH